MVTQGFLDNSEASVSTCVVLVDSWYTLNNGQRSNASCNLFYISPWRWCGFLCGEIRSLEDTGWLGEEVIFWYL